jgi:pimeloyl-ACP methyl ester carboxylesterase
MAFLIPSKLAVPTEDGGQPGRRGWQRLLKDFYNVDVLGGKRISDQVVQYSWNVAAAASAKGMLDCVPAWGTDFRKELPRITVPALVIHGDADRILPITVTGIPTHKAVKGSPPGSGGGRAARGNLDARGHGEP